jgi:hypothetical protein
LATSVAIGKPVASRALTSQLSATEPFPSNLFGRVRGFQIPARNMWTPRLESCFAVSTTCSLDSALQGPLMINGRSTWASPSTTD